MSILVLLMAGRCAQAKFHMEAPGEARCHRHQPLGHLHLWQLITAGAVPAGLLLLCRRKVRTWQRTVAQWLSILLPRFHGVDVGRGLRWEFPPPTFLAKALADGLSGGQPTFG